MSWGRTIRPSYFLTAILHLFEHGRSFSPCVYLAGDNVRAAGTNAQPHEDVPAPPPHQILELRSLLVRWRSFGGNITRRWPGSTNPGLPREWAQSTVKPEPTTLLSTHTVPLAHGGLKNPFLRNQLPTGPLFSLTDARGPDTRDFRRDVPDASCRGSTLPLRSVAESRRRSLR